MKKILEAANISVEDVIVGEFVKGYAKSHFELDLYLHNALPKPINKRLQELKEKKYPLQSEKIEIKLLIAKDIYFDLLHRPLMYFQIFPELVSPQGPLHTDLLISCFRHVPYRITMKTCALVCKYWYYATKSSLLWYSSLLYLKLRKIYYEKEGVKTLQQIPNNVHWYNRFRNGKQHLLSLKNTELMEKLINSLKSSWTKQLDVEEEDSLEMAMFHPLNARQDYEPRPPKYSKSELPPREDLIKILQRENELRL